MTAVVRLRQSWKHEMPGKYVKRLLRGRTLKMPLKYSWRQYSRAKELAFGLMVAHLNMFKHISAHFSALKHPLADGARPEQNQAAI